MISVPVIAPLAIGFNRSIRAPLWRPLRRRQRKSQDRYATTLGPSEASCLRRWIRSAQSVFSVLTDVDRTRYVVHYVTTHAGESGIIYAATRKEVDRLYKELKSMASLSANIMLA